MRYLLVCLCTFLLLLGCSGEQEENEKQSSIDKATKEVADKIVEHIKTPIEKAEAVKEVEEDRTRELQKQVE